jgi:hypothetical protein
MNDDYVREERLVSIGDRGTVYVTKSNVVGVREVVSSKSKSVVRVDTKTGDVFYVEGTVDDILEQIEESIRPLNG